MAVSCGGDPSSVRSRPFIAVALLLALLAGAVAAAAVFDAQAKSHVAKGVRVGGVDLGGLTAAQARAKLHRTLLAPLNEPIVVHHDRKSWTLDAARARIAADIAGMVDAALERSRQGSILSRAYRQAAGGRVDADLPAQVSFSRAAVRQLVSRIEQSINRAPKDATVEFSGSGVEKKPSQS